MNKNDFCNKKNVCFSSKTDKDQKAQYMEVFLNASRDNTKIDWTKTRSTDKLDIQKIFIIKFNQPTNVVQDFIFSSDSRCHLDRQQYATHHF